MDVIAIVEMKSGRGRRVVAAIIRSTPARATSDKSAATITVGSILAGSTANGSATINYVVFFSPPLFVVVTLRLPSLSLLDPPHPDPSPRSTAGSAPIGPVADGSAIDNSAVLLGLLRHRGCPLPRHSILLCSPVAADPMPVVSSPHAGH
uniref:Uncharacterized protein n=2 Tax=Oryza TaxID=4527 RepID=A0A0D3GNG0_9ORYZ